MKELEILTSMLATLGERGPTAVDSLHPYVVAARDVLTRVNRTEQGYGWYFNTERNRVFQPNGAGEILIPENTLTFVCKTHPGRFVLRDRVLYDMQNFTTLINEAVIADRVALIDYEQLPPMAAEYIRAAAVYDFFVQEDGEGTKHAAILSARDRARSQLYRAHVHWQQSNTGRSNLHQQVMQGTSGVHIFPGGTM